MYNALLQAKNNFFLKISFLNLQGWQVRKFLTWEILFYYAHGIKKAIQKKKIVWEFLKLIRNMEKKWKFC